eukprot:scaffold754_cov248-Pinguiococcus_pyrenoidosus.AAC.14
MLVGSSGAEEKDARHFEAKAMSRDCLYHRVAEYGAHKQKSRENERDTGRSGVPHSTALKNSIHI